MKRKWEKEKEMFLLKLLMVLFGATFVDFCLFSFVFIFVVTVLGWKVHES